MALARHAISSHRCEAPEALRGPGKRGTE